MIPRLTCWRWITTSGTPSWAGHRPGRRPPQAHPRARTARRDPPPATAIQRPSTATARRHAQRQNPATTRQRTPHQPAGDQPGAHPPTRITPTTQLTTPSSHQPPPAKRLRRNDALLRPPPTQRAKSRRCARQRIDITTDLSVLRLSSFPRSAVLLRHLVACATIL